MTSIIPRTHAAGALFVVVITSALTACAGSTLGSGVGDRMLREPPYYAGRILPVDGAVLAVLPIGYQRDAAEAPIFALPDVAGGALAALFTDMNAYLADSLSLDGFEPLGEALAGTPPDVMFRCVTDTFDDCAFPEDDTRPEMRLAVARPSAEWVAAQAAALDASGASHALLITLEYSDYWVYQRNLRGSKEVRLGTGRDVDLPWLTSLETPVSVLQLTGVIVDREGKAVRIGAEGILARRTSLALSALGAQATIRQEDVEALRAERREDLDGRPLVWQAALRNLLAGLTGRIEPAR